MSTAFQNKKKLHFMQAMPAVLFICDIRYRYDMKKEF